MLSVFWTPEKNDFYSIVRDQITKTLNVETWEISACVKQVADEVVCVWAVLDQKNDCSNLRDHKILKTGALGQPWAISVYVKQVADHVDCVLSTTYL